MTDYFQILSVIVAVFLIVYYYLTSTFDFWKDRGVVGPRPIPGFGNIKDVMLRKINIGDYITRLYKKYNNEPMIGIFARRSPSLILCDLDLIKDVLIKDFSTFSDRGLHVLERTDPFATNLFNIEARRWRPLRTKLSPVFTSGKLKEMFSLILECAENLEQYLEKVIEKGGFMDCCEITARFSTDVIGSCIFGINMNALSDEESKFRNIGRKIFDKNSKSTIRIIFRESFPWLYNFLWFLIPQLEVTKFVTKLVADTMKYREENNIVRPDFIHMLMELKKHPEVLGDIELTDTILAAQAFVFFGAGFETSSMTISHALYEMALNPDIQDKLRKEIIEFYVKTNGNLKYEQVKEMKYLDKIFRETLRKYSIITTLRRRCNANYTFSGTEITIPKGTEVLIPVYAIQRDSNIYADAEKFDPERFNEDAVAARHPMCYLPFGSGPRNCIGARFAIYQTKMGLIKILHKFKVDVCEKTITTYVHDLTPFMLSPKGGIHLKLSKVEN